MDKFLNKIIQGDCLEVMKDIPDNSVDSCITDPPYALGFMGKAWDKFPSDKGVKKPFANQSKEGKLGGTSFQNWTCEWAKEVLRTLKPGGYLLSFGGTRTYHRMVSGIEDAGFEIRDTIVWCYGQGFPKSRDIGKDIEKLNVGGIKNLKKIDTKQGIKIETGTQGFSYNKEYVPGKCMGGKQINGEIPVYEINNQWKGWGTALKPAVELIVLARKPIQEKTIAKNVLKYEVGALNIDKCRIRTEKIQINRHEGYNSNSLVESMKGKWTGKKPEVIGRFPANFIHDGSEEIKELFPNSKGWSSQNFSPFYNYRGNALNKSKTIREGFYKGYDDNGSAIRFFYCAKASKKERNLRMEGKGNYHPTVKPLSLIRYLIELVSKEGQIILDPFSGSGSTLIAAKQLKRNSIGIEKEQDYCEIAKKRLDSIPNRLL